jgi:D-alanyl-D-alanine dipeptidase
MIGMPITELKKIKIKDNGEPLIPLKKYCPKIFIEFWRKEDLAKEKTLQARLTVVRMLKKAQDFLPKGIIFKVRDAWRPLSSQQRNYFKAIDKTKKKYPRWPNSRLRREVNKWVFPPDTPVPPGHTTGAALDLTLCYKNGYSLPMRSYKKSSERLTAKNRKLLKNIMEKVGFLNYPAEWWHFSYGDSSWAFRDNKKIAIYGGTKPENY